MTTMRCYRRNCASLTTGIIGYTQRELIKELSDTSSHMSVFILYSTSHNLYWNNRSKVKLKYNHLLSIFYSTNETWNGNPTMKSFISEIDKRYDDIELYCDMYGFDSELSRTDFNYIITLLQSGQYHLSPLKKGMTEIFVSTADYLVIEALLYVVFKGLSSYYRSKRCYSQNIHVNVNDHINVNDHTLEGDSRQNSVKYDKMITEWSDVECLIRIECKREILIPRLIDKLRPILDSYLLQLIESFFKLKMRNNVGFITSNYSDGFPPSKMKDEHPYLNLIYELFNLLLDDIDQKIEERFPYLDYARFYEEIFIPIRESDYQYLKEDECFYKVIYDIFDECDFNSPTIERTKRGGKYLIPKCSSGIIMRVTEDGFCDFGDIENVKYANMQRVDERRRVYNEIKAATAALLKEEEEYH